MAAVTLSNIAAIIERLYGKGIKTIGLGPDAPLWSVMPKKSDFFESTYTLRNRYGKIPSGSRTFATARDYQGASPYGSFQLTRSKDYNSIAFEAETLKATAHNSERLVTYLQEEIDSALEKEALRMNHAAYRNAGGAIGQVASGGGTTVITVVDRETLIQVYPGMYLVSSNTDGTSGSVDANPTLVVSVDREAGTITAGAAWNAVAGFSDLDYFFAAGDFGLSFTGLASWVPPTAPGATTFYGQNRALDPVYLGGIRIEASAATDGTIERTFIRAAGEGKMHGAACSHIFMHPLDHAIFLNELGQRVQYNTVKGRLGGMGDKDAEVDVGIQGIRMTLSTGAADVIADNSCPRNAAWMLDMRTWAFYGLGMTGFEWAIDDGGGKFLRTSQLDVDGIEAIRRIYGQIGCTAPGCNTYVDLNAVL